MSAIGAHGFALDALSSFIRLQRLLYFWLKLHFIIQLFLLVWKPGLVLSPGTGYPRHATDTHTLVYERCV